ncbi:MAG TPA: hypothetical protein PLS49_00385 [Candidatus Woesebacteria bacterium]|nr:hypothetical protein [Candidatus Woesebacteria bacterium]
MSEQRNFPLQEESHIHTEIQFRQLDEIDCDILCLKLNLLDINSYLDGFDTMQFLRGADKKAPLLKLHDDFLAFLRKKYNITSVLPSKDQDYVFGTTDLLFNRFLGYPLAMYIQDHATLPTASEYIDTNQYGELSLSPAKGEVLFRDIGTAHEIAGNISALEGTFQNNMYGEISEDYTEAYPEIVPDIEAQHLDTPYQFMNYHFSTYLKQEGAEEAAEKFNTAKTIQEAKTALKEVSFIKELEEKEHELDRRIKEEPVQIRNKLRDEREALLKQKNKMQQVQLGMQQYVDMPAYFSQLYTQVIREVQDIVVDKHH